MRDDLLTKLLATFRVEAGEHLEHIRRLLVTLKGRPDPRGKELDEVFRRAHSLKGAARAVSLEPVEKVAHRLETLFSRMRDGTLSSSLDSFPVIANVLDAIEDWLAAHQSGKAAPDLGPTLESVEQIVSGAKAAALPPKVAAKTEPPLERPSEVTADESVRVNATRLEHLRRFSGEFLTEGMRQQGVHQHMRQMGSALVALEKSWDAFRHGSNGTRTLEGMDSHVRQLRRLMRSVQQTQNQTSYTFRRLG